MDTHATFTPDGGGSVIVDGSTTFITALSLAGVIITCEGGRAAVTIRENELDALIDCLRHARRTIDLNKRRAK